jgi:hypothetical protein
MGEGYEVEMDGDDVVIRIKLTKAAIKAAPKTSTGKAKLVASTHGWARVGPENLAAAFSLNLTVREKK